MHSKSATKQIKRFEKVLRGKTIVLTSNSNSVSNSRSKLKAKKADKTIIKLKS